MKVTVTPCEPGICAVRERPSWFERLRGQGERDYEAWHTRDLGGRAVWVTHDNRPVSARVAEQIERQMGGGQ